MKNRAIQMFVFAGVLMSATLLSPLAWAHDEPQRIEITAHRFAFTPGEITVKKGQPVVLVIKSADVSHGLRLHDLNINIKVGAGGTTEVKFTPEKTGDFVGHCSVFCGAGHGSMALKVHVVD